MAKANPGPEPIPNPSVLEVLEFDIKYWYSRKDEMLEKVNRRRALLSFCRRNNILDDSLAAEALKELLT